MNQESIPNNVPYDVDDTSVEDSEEQEHSKEEKRDRVKVRFEAFFEEISSPEERAKKMKGVLSAFFKYIDKSILSEEEIEVLNAKIESCKDITDKDDFVEIMLQVMEPVIQISINHKEKYEDAEARAMNDREGYCRINRLVSYEKSGSTIHIHNPVGETVKNKIGLYKDAMKKLAQIIHDDPDIEEVSATSYLVSKHPSLFTRIGFTVKDISKEVAEKHFEGQEGVKQAIMKRDDFLRRFLV